MAGVVVVLLAARPAADEPVFGIAPVVLPPCCPVGEVVGVLVVGALTAPVDVGLALGSAAGFSALEHATAIKLPAIGSALCMKCRRARLCIDMRHRSPCYVRARRLTQHRSAAPPADV
ncbi:MAG TPA: hypothetical protein VMF89_34430 [Polyangiales bacterium]|nr:hypothetical protein [Polyangiales bacterium]